VSGCAAFGSCPAGACSEDVQTAASVRAALAEHKEFLPGSIQVLAHARVVYLYGIAETDLERFHAESIAKSTVGVTRVVDFIGISNR
jgi:osmotically-inducible protein OsmY